MQTTFRYYLDTGSGRTHVTLHFLGTDHALMEYDSRWMGSDVKRYKLHWTHKPFSEHYGVLILRALERYTSLTENETIMEAFPSGTAAPALIADDYLYSYDDITFEYIRLPKSEVWIADSPDLEEMKNFFGLAKWNATFDLLLWFRFSFGMAKGEMEGTELGNLLTELDKMKFTITSAKNDEC